MYQFVVSPKRRFGKIATKLEDDKINYIVIDPRNNYDIDEKSDYRNLNTYEEEFQKAYSVIKQRNKINRIKEKLEKYIGKKEFKTIIGKVEEILDEN